MAPTFTCMQKKPADKDGIPIEVKFTGLTGFNQVLSNNGTGSVQTNATSGEYESVISADVHLVECDDSGAVTNNRIVQHINFDSHEFEGWPVSTASTSGDIVDVTNGIVTRCGSNQIFIPRSESFKNNKLYRCYVDFYTDLGNVDTANPSGEFYLMGNEWTVPSIVSRKVSNPNSEHIYLKINWGLVPLAQKSINIRAVGDNSSIRGTSVSFVNDYNFTYSENGEQNIVLCKTLPTTGVSTLIASKLAFEAATNSYYVQFGATNLVNEKLYAITASTITRGLVHNISSPPLMVAYTPGRFSSPTIVSMKLSGSGSTPNQYDMYFKEPEDVLVLKGLTSDENPSGILQKSFLLTTGATTTYSKGGILLDNLSQASPEFERINVLKEILISDLSPVFGSGMTLKPDGTRYYRGPGVSVPTGETDITGCRVYSNTVSYNIPSTSTTITVGLTAKYSGGLNQDSNLYSSTNVFASSVSTVQLPLLSKLEVVPDKNSNGFATGNITLNVDGKLGSRMFNGLANRVKLYWAKTSALEAILNGTPAVTASNGDVTAAVAGRPILLSDFKDASSAGNTISNTLSLATGFLESSVYSYGSDRKYMIKMTRANIITQVLDGDRITFFATIVDDNGGSSVFDYSKAVVYNVQGAPVLPTGGLSVSLSSKNDVVVKAANAVTNFGLGLLTKYACQKAVDDDATAVNLAINSISRIVNKTSGVSEGELSVFSSDVANIYNALSTDNKALGYVTVFNNIREAIASSILSSPDYSSSASKLTTASTAAATANLGSAFVTTINTAKAAAAAAATSATAQNLAALYLALRALADSTIAQISSKSQTIRNLYSDQTKVLVENLRKATGLEDSAKVSVTIGFSSHSASDSLMQPDVGLKFITLSPNDYKMLVGGEGYTLKPSENAVWLPNTKLNVRIESVNANSLQVGEALKFESVASEFASVIIRSSLSSVKASQVQLYTDDAGTSANTNGDLKYMITPPQLGAQNLIYKLSYKINNAAASAPDFYIQANSPGISKYYVLINKGVTTASANRGTIAAPIVVSNINYYDNSVTFTTDIGSYDFGDLISVDIIAYSSSTDTTNYSSTPLQLVPSKPATIDSIVLSTANDGTVNADDDVLTYYISNNGSALVGLYTFEIFGKDELSDGSSPVTSIALKTKPSPVLGGPIRNTPAYKDEFGLIKEYGEAVDLLTVDTNASHVVSVVSQNSASKYVPKVVHSSGKGAFSAGVAERRGAVVPTTTVLQFRYPTANDKLYLPKGGAKADYGIMGVFATLSSTQVAQVSAPSFKLAVTTGTATF
jgi:hypothetical protein